MNGGACPMARAALAVPNHTEKHFMDDSNTLLIFTDYV